MIDHYRHVPEVLKRENRWMLWGNFSGTKLPLQLNGKPAKSNDSTTWTDFASVQNEQRIAFVIDSPFCGVDLDNCIDDQGELREWARPIVEQLGPVSYAEISPSGLGIKFTTIARKPDGSRCVHKFGTDKQQLECYDKARFWTITGEAWGPFRDVSDGQQAVDWLCQAYLTPERPATVPAYRVPVMSQADDLLTRATAYVDSVPGEVKGNLRNAAFRLAGSLHAFTDDLGRRLGDSQVLDLLRGWNTRNNPPLRDDELAEAAVNGRKNGTPRPDKLPAAFPDVDLSGVDLSALIEPRPVAQPTAKAEDKLPAELLHVPGLIGDIVQHNLRTAHYPLPELALAGALSLMSALTGGKVIDRVRTRTNLYVIGLAPSGGGKDHSRKLNRLILREAGHGQVVGPERIGSHAGIISTMAEQWLTLFQIDEIAHLVMAMQDRHSPHLVQIAAVLMQLFSSADSEWISDAYGDRNKVKRLLYPHAVVYGTSVPEGFWESLTEENLKGGLIGRCLVFESRHYVDYQEPADDPIPPAIIDRAKYWLDLQTHTGNLPVGGAHPRRVDRDQSAHERLHQHTLDISKRRMSEDPLRSAIWSRTAEKTNKLALLFACSRADEDWPTIRLEDADRAIRLNNWLTRRMLHAADRHVADSEHHRLTNRMLRMFEESPGKTWTASEITRRTKHLQNRQRQEILAALLQTGEIVQQAVETGGRPATVFALGKSE